ncbi:MAG: DUF3372 domain-containing protein [Bacteriovoracaceae bacterium]|nr:DUF3372 domain-containing protein [Bacteriovoracaceae bacterium]
MIKTILLLISVVTLSVANCKVISADSFLNSTLPLKGIWISDHVIAIDDINPTHYKYIIHFDEDEGIVLDHVGHFDAESEGFYKKFDYVSHSNYAKFFINLSSSQLKRAIKGSVKIVKKDLYSDQVVDQFSLSLAGLLDQRFSYNGDKLGPTFNEDSATLRLWAPTAQRVAIHFYYGPNTRTEILGSPFELKQNSENVWIYTGKNLKGLYYRYEIESYKRRLGGISVEQVTDLYSTNLSMNSLFSHLIDVSNDSMPSRWRSHELNSKHAINDFSDISIYELHVRDFSYFDESQPEEHRGKFMAFTNAKSNGVRHLKKLADAGISHIHLLPVTDQSSVEEDETKRLDLSLEDFKFLQESSGSGEAQQIMAKRIRGRDGFNWGYDPLHYQALEGSYSTDPNSDARIIEFRKMVMSLHSMGLGVVADTVFNHYSGLLNLDSYVPDYYYSLNNCGDITNDSCCPDLATENKMVHKLIVDSALNLVKWYRLDGIRFDLMGFLTKSLMKEIRVELDKLTPQSDGVDGKKVFMYGEGWHFGPLVRKLPAEAVTQHGAAAMNMGIATFNDRFRDAVKGKGQNSKDLFTDDAFVTDKMSQRENVLMGLMGSLKGIKGGYVNNPGESINYITAHDKTTLWDTLVAKTGLASSTDQLVRLQQLSLSFLSLAQGVPFFHAGVEILRSKSGDENSYDSGDWFNKIDYSYQNNGWRGGLPPSWIHENLNGWGKWNYRLNYVSSPTELHIRDTMNHFLDLQRIRRSSKLFRLSTREQVLQKVSLPEKLMDENGNFDPRLVVVKLDDRVGEDVDPDRSVIWVAFNTSWSECLSFEDSDLIGTGVQLHPILQQSDNRFAVGANNHHCRDGRAKGRMTIPPQSTMVYYIK